MKRKIFQITILSLFILISFLFFKIYLEKNKVTNNIRKLNEKNIVKETNEITEINYTTEDIRGNTYNIKAQYGEIDIDNPDIIFLTNVIAIISQEDGDINITSDYGKYNAIDHHSIFSRNVEANYLENKITGDYLDFSFLKNYASMSGNIVYNNLDTKMKADIINIDLTTKESQIFMNDSTKKILINNN